jgi:hypothetical protein
MFGGIVDAISSVGKAITAPVAGVIGAGLNFLGGTQQNQSAWDISQAANASSAEQAANQMAFQERMRSTQYQTAVDDIKKAGLNPMLAYSQGGAGTPTGAAGTVYTAPVRNVLGEAVNAYLAATQNDADVALKQTAASNTSAQTIKVEADTIKTAAEIGKVLEDTKVSTQTYKNMQEALNKLIAEISQIKASTGLTSATTKNVQENIAPSVDPYWYRDLKKGISSARDFVDKLKYKGVSVLPNFGGSKK